MRAAGCEGQAWGFGTWRSPCSGEGEWQGVERDVFAQQSLELHSRNRSGPQARQVRGGELAVDDHDAVAQTQRNEVRERPLRSVALAAEHRLSEEHPAQAYAVEASDELAAMPRFDTV